MKRSALWWWLTMVALTLTLADGAFAISSDSSPTAQQKAAAAPGKALDDVWPKPVDEFLSGKYLERADVMLTRRSGDIASALIRWGTHSAFSHAAMVYTGPQFDQGISGTFVIEAGTSGVDLTQFSHYAQTKSAFVAIKRLKRSWFDANRQARVRGVLLDKIKDSYDYWTIWRVVRNIWFGVQTKVRSKEKTVETYRRHDWQPPNEYICSGLVQIGFVQAVIEGIQKGQLSPEVLRDVVFSPSAASRLPAPGDWKYFDAADAKATAINFQDVLSDELYSVTPEDLAQSDKLEWMYLIKDDKVYQVHSYAEVLKLVQ